MNWFLRACSTEASLKYYTIEAQRWGVTNYLAVKHGGHYGLVVNSEDKETLTIKADWCTWEECDVELPDPYKHTAQKRKISI